LGLYTEKVILEAVILTAVVVIALTLYTFWAASRGYDFNFLGPFLFGAILVLMVFGLIQVLRSSKTIVSKITTPVSGFG
jgi:FtsH-binding integral membrane protein